jgi:integrase
VDSTELHPVLANAPEAGLGPEGRPRPGGSTLRRLWRRRSEDGDSEGVQGGGHSALVAHDLRHRRISLLHLRGVPWARIGEFVGQRNLSITADTYTHVLVDEAELDYGRLLAGRAADPVVHCASAAG